MASMGASDPFRVVLASYTKQVDPDHRMRVAKLHSGRLSQLEAIRDSLFEIEVDAREKVLKKMERYKTVTYTEFEAELDREYRRIDMNFLGKMTKRESHMIGLGIQQRPHDLLLPCFATFELERPKFEITYLSNLNQILYYGDHAMVQYYDWLIEKNKDVKSGFEITAQFSGILPDRVREHILNVKDKFYKIYIVAEVPKWSVKRINIDPLVVGRWGPNFWLIDKFDLTPAEKWVLDNYLERRF